MSCVEKKRAEIPGPNAVVITRYKKDKKKAKNKCGASCQMPYILGFP